MILALVVFICFLIANRHTVANTINDDEIIQELIAAEQKRQAELEALYETYSGEEYIGGRISTAKYFKLTQKNDLGWDVVDFEYNHHHPSNYAKRGSHGSKGQRKAKQQTLEYKAARKLKYMHESV